MDTAKAILTLQHGSKVARIPATRVRFSAHQCFARDGGIEDRRCLESLADHLKVCTGSGLAVFVDDATFFQYFLRHVPCLRDQVRCVISEGPILEPEGIPVVAPDALPSEVDTVFLCETRAFPRMQMRKRLPERVHIIDPEIIPDIAMDQVPSRAWSLWSRDIIYPLDLPEIQFAPGLDMLLIDCPARNLGLMPNGVGYVHNALKLVDVKYQTWDLDIIIYHRFHIRRLFDEGGTIRLPSGRALPSDPWQAEHYDLWSDKEVLAYFEPEIEEIVAKIVAARPKILGMSIHACNEHFSTAVAQRVKTALPEIVLLVGGFSCYSPDIGLRGFPLADYMCIGEADLTVGPLVERLAAGERPANIPGVLSRFDRPEVPFIPAPMPHDLDLLEHPRYEWYELSIYRNYNGYQLTPVIASRGCRWSRCTFCAERFYWRIRSAKAFVDELEWLVSQGCRLFMFNESDLNGKPEVVLEICDEIIRRNLNVKLTGQLRIHKKCDRAFFQKLRQAGFVALRFGVDAFSENTLRLQKKGYTTATVCQNLRDCWEAGIYTEVNWVIGVPGETDEDIEEGIDLILRNKPYIGRLANINPLILVTGGVYWMEPEKHNIHFRGNKEELYQTYPRAIPAHLWYSTNPYIDEKVRKQRFERIVLALYEGHFDVGAWAHRVIEDVKKNRDINRAGARTGTEDPVCNAAGNGQGATAHAESSISSVRLSTTEDEPAPSRKLSDGIGRMQKPSPVAGDDLEFNADARSSSYVFRAGSSLPEDPAIPLHTQLYLIRSGEELFGIEPEDLASGFGRGQFPGLVQTPSGEVIGAGSLVLDTKVKVQFVQTPAATPELIQSIGIYNIVAYDSLYYAVPQWLGQISWGEENVATLPGVLTSKQLGHLCASLEKNKANVGQTVPELGEGSLAPNISPFRASLSFKIQRTLTFLRRKISARTLHNEWKTFRKLGVQLWLRSRLLKKAGQILTYWRTPPFSGKESAISTSIQEEPVGKLLGRFSLKTVTAPQALKSLPTLVTSLQGYNIVEYEGWFYGLPQSLGPVDLDQTDVIEIPGVIRDLSRDVVESEIAEVSRLKHASV